MIDHLGDHANGRTVFSTAAELAAILPGSRRAGDGYMARCPVHQDRTPSLSIRDGDTAPILKCFSKGCSYKAIMAAIGGEVVPTLPGAIRPSLRVDSSEKAALAIWNSAQPVCMRDPVWTYLNGTRRLSLETIPAVLRISTLKYWEHEQDQWQLVGTYPAMVGAFTSASGDVVAVHRTFLTPDGQKAFAKDSGRDSRKALGPTNGSAIKLFRSTDRIGIAEGIETALAAHRLFDIPTWAAYSASNLQNIAIPDSVQEIVIFADHDQSGVGQEAAKKLARRVTAEGRRAKIITPDQPGDWADVLFEEA